MRKEKSAPRIMRICRCIAVSVVRAVITGANGQKHLVLDWFEFPLGFGAPFFPFLGREGKGKEGMGRKGKGREGKGPGSIVSRKVPVRSKMEIRGARDLKFI